METFRIDKESYDRYVKRQTRYILPILVIILAIFIATQVLTARGGEWITTTLIATLAMSVYGAFSYRRMGRRWQPLLSYMLTLTDSEIIREQDKVPPLTIHFMEVKEIFKTKKGGFIIKGRTSTDTIYVPFLIERKDALEKRLQTFAPVTVWAGAPWRLKLIGYLPLLAVAGLIVINVVKDEIIAGVAGLAAIAVMGWLFVYVQRSKNVTAQAKRRSWIFLLFVALVGFIWYMRFEA
jgi:hypothetical protein